MAYYVEERYGRNLSRVLGPLAKTAIRRRIAGVLCETAAAEHDGAPDARVASQSNRAIAELTENDVWLYPSGMSAIFHTHLAVSRARERTHGRAGHSICLGFPYTDTLKILQKWGPGCHHLRGDTVSDLDNVRDLLVRHAGGVQALFCEFPSNPLLRSPDMRHLRRLADEFGFVIVVDETIGTFCNVEVLPLADIVVSSLTKVFSGESNVMGGSMVVNPRSSSCAALRAAQDDLYEDALFDDDAIFLERNSRTFRQRIAHINESAAAVCALVWQARGRGVVKEVYFPRYTSTQNYLACARTSSSAAPAWGGLFSVTFESVALAKRFYDALACHKGPSLGTNFTLASPYTLLAHYTELDWAAEWGVDAALVRISVGMEPVGTLLSIFAAALRACVT